MRIVSIGDLVTDFYYKNNKLLGVNGGMTSHNIIANLSKMNFNTAIFGVCGNDMTGKIAIKSLKDLNVDTNDVKVMDKLNTRCFHVSYFEENGSLSFSSKKRCPKCNNKKWYETSAIDPEYVLNNILKDDVLVFDNLNDKNQVIIDNCENKKVLDLGQYFEFENMHSEEIIRKIQNKFEILNLNERVFHFLIKKLNVNNELELYRILKPKLLTITLGDKGAIFIFDNNEQKFSLKRKGNVVDPTGAGDAFVSCLIREIVKNNFVYDENDFRKWYENSNKLTEKVVSKMGARGHLKSLYKIKEILGECTCDNFTITDRKQIKRCNININNLEKRIKNAINSSSAFKIKNINISESDNCLFVGTGGSYAGALFASKIVNQLFGCNTYSLLPRDVLYRNNAKIDKVFLFTYSGTTADIINCIRDFDKNKIYFITKGDTCSVVTKTACLKSNIISYRSSTNKGKERGFLSFEGSVAPASIFLKYYLDEKNINLDLNLFVENSVKYWNSYFKNFFDNNNFAKDICKFGMINIFGGDYTWSACCDLESKIIESGIVNCIVHEKKNFSHGRFINYENLNNIYSIYFKQKITDNYEKELLNYLKTNILLVESQFEGILAEFDLLIASQYIIYYLGKTLDIDVSKPKYSDDAMKIYFYKKGL